MRGLVVAYAVLFLGQALIVPAAAITQVDGVGDVWEVDRLTERYDPRRLVGRSPKNSKIAGVSHIDIDYILFEGNDLTVAI